MKKVIKHVFVCLCAWSISSTGWTQEKLTDDIRLNQIGFYPNAPKIAAVYTTQGDDFFITKEADNKKLFTGKLSGTAKSPFSKKQTRIADFSAFKEPGEYVLVVPGVGRSYPFNIRNNVHQEVAKAAAKAFYFHRLSTDLPDEYAGVWKRQLGHPDDKVLIHASAASPNRPEGTVISSPRGWYDAGDYNKYIVNSGITVGTLLSSYEDFPAYWQATYLNIPESNNGVPDLLDEILWNLRWMLTMQDPHDGGVYHKLTNPKFDGMVMPHEATNIRYVVQKSTAATLDFAAVLAQASRVYKSFERQFPGLSDSCIHAARHAWEWAQKNPAVEYRQVEMNKNFDPDVVTGAYGDRDVSDEFIWAASELMITTNDSAYSQKINVIPDGKAPLPSWSQVRFLAYYSLARFENKLKPGLNVDIESIKKNLLALADSLIADTDQHYLRTVMGKTVKDYIWGSSSVAANQSIALIQAHKITKDQKYLRHALTNVDYLLGRNGTGYSFVTGFGDKQVMHPHHRPSEADGISAPVPGWLSGGPNPSMQDRCDYPSAIPDEAFTDHVCSYASNEVAINWNAPLVYVLCAMESLQEAFGAE
ncbi:MAG TPA: glycoside hydrolase family 9 protein [Ohtaekwangia sp.]|nr:glycoside hydrolase family 9 protein [Ohtaekwangia sp.]